MENECLNKYFGYLSWFIDVQIIFEIPELFA